MLINSFYQMEIRSPSLNVARDVALFSLLTAGASGRALFMMLRLRVCCPTKTTTHHFQVPVLIHTR